MDAPEITSRPNTAVLELFTSEGCSSCPPADALLREIAERSFGQGTVIALSFHVDYWNYLGFKDPFSSTRYSERQRWYASLESSRRVYTPQAIVDGKTRLVGSKRNRILSQLTRALAEVKPAVIDVNTHRPGQLSYTIRNYNGEALLQFVTVLQEASSRVNAGENAGKVLRHVNVVKSVQTRRVTSPTQGQWLFKPPKDPEALKYVLMVQEPLTGNVLGAVVWP